MESLYGPAAAQEEGEGSAAPVRRRREKVRETRAKISHDGGGLGTAQADSGARHLCCCTTHTLCWHGWTVNQEGKDDCSHMELQSLRDRVLSATCIL